MIMGVGVDLCSIDRMRRALTREGFATRLFTKDEIYYAENSCDAASHLAATFAAKEALAKACGLGLAKMGLRSASILRGDRGPYFKFTEEFSARLHALGVTRTHLSISHESGMAIAMVVLEE